MMPRSAKKRYVSFVDENLKKNFEKLEKGKFEDEQLREFISRAIEDIKKNPFCGVLISKKLWPKEYIKKYSIKNLWKYNLPNSWRLIYTIKEDEISILNILIEWFNHKDYERRFRY